MLTKEEIIQICRDSLEITNLTNSGTDTDKYSFKLYFETVADKISSRLDAPVILQNVAPCNDHGLVFKGIRKDGKFYTLDGQKEIFDPYYKKYSSITLLTEEEQKFLLNDYLKMRTIISQCASILSK